MAIAQLEEAPAPSVVLKKQHPAKYSPEILRVLYGWVCMEAFYQGKRQRRMRILDPFAGTGRIHTLPGKTFGVELEYEWASQHPRTEVGNALNLRWRKNSFDLIITSPCYGNRFCDAYEAKDGSRRRSYKFDLGRMPSKGSAAVLPWGEKYRAFHLAAWKESLRVLRPGGAMYLNISDHIRNGEPQPVSMWHRYCLEELAMTCFAQRDISTSRLRYGQNHGARVPYEHVFAFRMPQ